MKGHDLDGYLFGTQPIPEKMISIMEKYGETKFILNPAYVKWVQTNQRLLCWLVSFISKSVFTQGSGSLNNLRDVEGTRNGVCIPSSL